MLPARAAERHGQESHGAREQEQASESWQPCRGCWSSHGLGCLIGWMGWWEAKGNSEDLRCIFDLKQQHLDHRQFQLDGYFHLRNLGVLLGVGLGFRSSGGRPSIAAFHILAQEEGGEATNAFQSKLCDPSLSIHPMPSICTGKVPWNVRGVVAWSTSWCLFLLLHSRIIKHHLILPSPHAHHRDPKTPPLATRAHRRQNVLRTLATP